MRSPIGISLLLREPRQEIPEVLGVQQNGAAGRGAHEEQIVKFCRSMWPANELMARLSANGPLTRRIIFICHERSMMSGGHGSPNR